MIITNDKNFPRIVLIINNFNKLEADTLAKEVIRLNEKAQRERIHINFHVDLYFLKDYNNNDLKQAIDKLAEKSFEYVNSITLYLNNNVSNFMLKAAIYMYKLQYNLPIKYVETKKHIVLK